jgi:hypothetical protein
VTADSYLHRVDAALRDLPWKMRRDLVSELRVHLAELPAESDLEVRLGTPEDYAADLRAAAGIERRHGPVAFLRARRPRTLILTALALTVIGLAIGAASWVQSYQPIKFDGGTLLPEHASPEFGSNNESVVFHKGRPFRYGVTILNNGRFTVRVLGVPYAPVLPFSARLLMSAPTKAYNPGGPFKSFEPFNLKPGEMTVLLLKGVYACHTGTGRGPSLTMVALPVRSSFLWRTTTTWIPLDGSLTFRFPRGCPSASPSTP